jgi:sugar/nucleoside kinase (ribokinase family)
VTIVVVGDLMVDVVAALPGELARGSDTPARISHSQGGSGANVAAWLAAAGADVAFAGRAGADPLGDAALAALAGVELAVERDPERPTGTCIVLVHPGGERTMIPDAGANEALELVELPAGEHLHLTGYALLRESSRPAALRALALARERGMTVSVDPSSAAPLATGRRGAHDCAHGGSLSSGRESRQREQARQHGERREAKRGRALHARPDPASACGPASMPSPRTMLRICAASGRAISIRSAAAGGGSSRVSNWLPSSCGFMKCPTR